MGVPKVIGKVSMSGCACVMVVFIQNENPALGGAVVADQKALQWEQLVRGVRLNVFIATHISAVHLFHGDQ